ncbi:MAG: tRNA dihydrouridine synthase DusB [Holosporaceae bacterium]|jgi:tRNA-dihydrouridine synthase B|nr:tRNA dihydrouridine synthase DusB [Holosporaceae bacterium]
MNFLQLFHSDTPIFLAPMAGITDMPFRRLVSSFGASATVSEMVSCEAMVRRNPRTYGRLVDGSPSLPKIVQIFGSNPQNMAESAKLNEYLGADAIDINMGCPARKIISNNAGAALLKDEELAVKIAECVVTAVNVPVTVKMRLGWDAEHINFLRLAKKFEDVGVKMLSIHCRTRNQMYSGSANWSAIAELKNIIRIPYICNGDIKTPEDAVTAMDLSRADGVMVGRGALGKPWRLCQIMDFVRLGKITPPPSLPEQLDIVLGHFQDTLNFYGETRGLRVFRKHFCWYSDGLNGASRFREIINRSDNIVFMENAVRDIYEKQFRELSGDL